MTVPKIQLVDDSRCNLSLSPRQPQLAFRPNPEGTCSLRCGRELTLPKLLKQNGVKMLAGSDIAVIANWCIPGFSLHQGFALLAASGLSPLEILQMTTLNGAQFLGREATMGTVDQGKNADPVLLDANPIEDVANLDKIRPCS